MEARVDLISSMIAQRGLAARPLGASFGPGSILQADGLNAPSLAFAAVEAYLAAPGDPSSSVNVANLESFIDQAKNRIRSVGKSAILIMQAYDEDSTWTNIPNLVDLQAPVYLEAYNDPVVTAILAFNYGRQWDGHYGGTHYHTELQTPHKDIAAAMGLTGRWKLDGSGGCYFDAYDSGPDQCQPAPTGRWKLDGNGVCYWDANDSGPNQCVPPRASLTEGCSRVIRSLSPKSSDSE